LALSPNIFVLHQFKNKTMGQMVSHKGELLRINVEKNFIEYSSNVIKVWHRGSSQSSQTFQHREDIVNYFQGDIVWR
jgi:hypothetical protein